MLLRMLDGDAKRGQVLQADTPFWTPLELVVGTELAGWFMWMYEVELTDGRRVHAYKNSITRRYLHLDREGRALAYSSRDRYVRVPLAAAITEAFTNWKVGKPSPSEVAALICAVQNARKSAR